MDKFVRGFRRQNCRFAQAILGCFAATALIFADSDSLYSQTETAATTTAPLPAATESSAALTAAAPPAATPPAAETPSPVPAAVAPLSVRIDQMLTSQLPHLTAGRAPDGLLLRRMSLDVRGVAPTGEELSEFIVDTDPAKWAKWTRKFLSDPLHQECMVDWYDKTLMQRRPNVQVDRATWRAWLRDVVEKRTPLNIVATQMISAPWWDESQRPPLRFFLDRSGDPHLITRDLGRILLGRDMQCAQCHDHPTVDEYKQFDYHGLLAFVSSSAMVEATTKDDKGADKKLQTYVERPGADAPFESVFDKGIALRSGPRLPVSTEIFEAYLEPDARLKKGLPPVAFAGVPDVPVDSRRQQLAQSLLTDQPRAMARNFANRLWALVFGRGLVDALDMQHADNPASHPELLELLTTELIASQFNVDSFLEQLLLTDAYCRAAELPLQVWPVSPLIPVEAAVNEIAELTQAAQIAKDRSASQLVAALQADELSEQAMETSKTAWRAAQVARNAARGELDKVEAVFVDAKKKSDLAVTARDVAVKKHQDTTSRLALLDEASAKLHQALTLLAIDDAELKQAIATAKARAETARAEVPAMEKVASDSTVAAAAALAAVDAPRADVQAKAALLTAQQGSLVAIDQAYATARQDWASKHTSRLVIEKEIEQFDRVLALSGRLTEARGTLAERTAAEGQVAAHQAQLATLQSQLVAAAAAVTVGQTERDAATATLATAQQALVAHMAQLDQLGETLKQLENAVVIVAIPDTLKSATQTIQETLAAKSSASAQLVTVITTAEQAVAASAEKFALLEKTRLAAEAATAAMQTTIVAAQAEVAARTIKLDEAISLARDAWDAAMVDRRKTWAVAEIRSQSPEQLCWSLLRVTGIFDNYINAELAEIAKTQPLPADADAATIAKRQQLALRQTTDKLRGNIDLFVTLYASGVGQTTDEFFASPDQALYMSNGGSVFPWASINGQNVTQRIVAQTDKALAANDLYGTLLARQPTAGESAFVSEQLTAGSDQPAAIAQELVWGILSSVEFRFYR